MVNWGGAGSGAVSGAAAGSTFGPWGAAAGGIIGGLSGLFGGSDSKMKKLATGTKEQEALQNQILAQAMGMGQGGGYDLANQYYNNLLGPNSPAAFEQFSSPYMQQFQEQVLPGIAERFAGAGALSSSGFGQALGGAASGLQSQLAALFSQLQGQAAQQQYSQYNQLAALGLNRDQFAYQKSPGSAGFAAPFLAGLSGEIGKAGGNALAKNITDLFKPKTPAATTGGIT
jgi:hypothetical protein